MRNEAKKKKQKISIENNIMRFKKQKIIILTYLKNSEKKKEAKIFLEVKTQWDALEIE